MTLTPYTAHVLFINSPLDVFSATAGYLFHVRRWDEARSRAWLPRPLRAHAAESSGSERVTVRPPARACGRTVGLPGWSST